jgi:hypothetical protein
MFAFAEIQLAIAPNRVPADGRDIELPELDTTLQIGVGRGGDDSYVLVGQGQATAPALRGQRFTFDPWMELVDRGSGTVLKDVCVLKFWPVDDLDEIRSAIAAVFAGLIELATSSPSSLGSAIAAMESLFEAGLSSRVPRETEIGLAGELLLIAESPEPSTLVAMWHSRADSMFDFSAQGERLEVKTTTAAERVHWFSSGQLRPIPGVCTTFVSLLLPLVEVGTTIASLYADLTHLTADERARVRSVILDVAHEPPEMLTSVVFDRGAAATSTLHILPGAVPAPTGAPGVGRIRWEATVGPEADRPDSSCGLVRAIMT